MEQSICTLWNLSVDEKLRVKIANPDVLPLLIKSLKDEDIRVKEAVGGVLANLTLTHSNHDIMVEAGVIPKLVRVLSTFITRQFESWIWCRMMSLICGDLLFKWKASMTEKSLKMDVSGFLNWFWCLSFSWLDMDVGVGNNKK